MLETIVYVENNLSYENYYSFRESVGWKNFSKQQAQDALQHTYYSIVAMAGEQAIGMARLIGDGMYFMIAEQGKEDFYERLGFKRIPHEFCGAGMRKVIYKE